MIEPTLKDRTLKKWIERQGPWPLDKAIWLMLQVEPGTLKGQISDKNSKMPAAVIRAYTKARLAIDIGELADIWKSNPKKISAADYGVDKKQFIAWAENAWNDTAHLTRALEAYDNLEQKPWQTDQDSQLAITHKFFVKVMDGLGLPDQKSLSHSAVYKKMKKAAGYHSGIHGKTRAIELMNQWRN